MKERVVKTNPEHEVVYQELAALINRHAENITAAEILAIASNMIGKLIALQDQRTMTTELAMVIVGTNIEVGNQQMLAMLMATKGSA